MVQIGRLTVDAKEAWTIVNYKTDFIPGIAPNPSVGYKPTVLTSMITANSESYADVRVRSPSPVDISSLMGFEVAFQKDDSDSVINDLVEDVAYIAMNTGNGTIDLIVEGDSENSTIECPIHSEVLLGLVSEEIYRADLPWVDLEMASGGDEYMLKREIPDDGIQVIPRLLMSITSFIGGDSAHVRIDAAHPGFVDLFIGQSILNLRLFECWPGVLSFSYRFHWVQFL